MVLVLLGDADDESKSLSGTQTNKDVDHSADSEWTMMEAGKGVDESVDDVHGDVHGHSTDSE